MSHGQPLVEGKDIEKNTGTTLPQLDILDVERWVGKHGRASLFQTPMQYQAPDLAGAQEVATQNANIMQNRTSSGFATQNPFQEAQPRMLTDGERQSLLIMTLTGGLFALLAFSFFSGKPIIE